ncbi:hypothetical protein FRC10_000049 [Ceratobasidium sp. 414]|nr:hypothetical protein FRC10_000049 [Ceratobasidium sp. 414]
MGIVSRISALASNLLDTLTPIIRRVYAVFEALESTPTPPTHAEDEDLGFTITRTTQPTTPLSPPIQTSHPLITIPDSPSFTPDSPIALETVTPRSPSPPQSTLESPGREIFPPEAEAGKIRIVPRDAGVTTKKVKKRRKVRDEIDDIFG